MIEAENTALEEAFEKSNDKANEMLDTLGKKELEIVSSFEKFADLWEQIQNKVLTVNWNDTKLNLFPPAEGKI